MPRKLTLKPYEPLERDHQAALVDWIDRYGVTQYPDLRWWYAIPNGAQYGSENRYKEAGRMRMLGLRKGVPDWCLPVPRGGWLGVYGEMKRNDKAKVTPEQMEWLTGLHTVGYYTAVFVSAGMAIELITRYMRGEIKRI